MLSDPGQWGAWVDQRHHPYGRAELGSNSTERVGQFGGRGALGTRSAHAVPDMFVTEARGLPVSQCDQRKQRLRVHSALYVTHAFGRPARKVPRCKNSFVAEAHGAKMFRRKYGQWSTSKPVESEGTRAVI